MNAEETAAAFKAPKGERGPCPEGGIYSGGEKYPKDVGFCCDKVRSCAGPRAPLTPWCSGAWQRQQRWWARAGAGGRAR